MTLGGSGNVDPPFDGSVSCLQIFDYGMDPATVHFKKYCPDFDTNTNPCRIGQRYFDGVCYGMAPAPNNFASAEVACLPEVSEVYESQLAWTENIEHWDFMAHLVKTSSPNADSFWAGISDRDKDGFFVTSHGSNITSSSDLLIDISDPLLPCGIVKVTDAGYVLYVNKVMLIFFYYLH